MKRSHKPATILMTPDYRHDNPYQMLLADALEGLGYRVLFPENYRRVFPLYRSTRTAGCDILHLHWLSPYLKGHNTLIRLAYAVKLIVDLLLVRAAGIRIFWTIHNVVSHDSPYAPIELWISRHIARLATSLIVHSNTAAEMAAAAYSIDQKQITVIPHGHFRTCYGPARASRLARQRLGISQDARVFVNLGMLRPYKGIENLLEAWQTHQASHPNDFLLIAGQPLDETYLSTLRALSNDLPGVELRPGYISDAKLPDYMSAADVVVLPFRRILTSGSLILAMSYGKPVIAPDLPTVRETLGNATDLLFEPGDPQSLVRTLARIDGIDLDVLRQKTVEACDHLDWRHIGQLTDKVYRSDRSVRPAFERSSRDVKHTLARPAELNR